MNAWEIVSHVLTKTASHVEPGISTFTLDAIAEKELKKIGGFSFNKGYHPKWARAPFSTTTCISVNNEIAHGIPSVDRFLKEGDLVNIDIGIIAPDGQCGDAALSLPVGKISEKDEMLLRYAKAALYAGIEKIKNGVTVEDIARAIESKVSERGFVVNRQLTGHKIGKTMHEAPYIYHVPNFYQHNKEKYFEYQKYLDEKLTTGMIVCLEPSVTGGDPFGFPDPNTGWTFYTKNGAKSAMFEHMVRVLDDGYEILTTHVKSWKEQQQIDQQAKV